MIRQLLVELLGAMTVIGVATWGLPRDARPGDLPEEADARLTPDERLAWRELVARVQTSPTV
jgi:hypothetical protein